MLLIEIIRWQTVTCVKWHAMLNQLCQSAGRVQAARGSLSSALFSWPMQGWSCKTVGFCSLLPIRSPGMRVYLARCTAGMLVWVWWCVIGMATCRSGSKHCSGYAIKLGRSHSSLHGSPQEMLSSLCHSCLPCCFYSIGWKRLVLTEECLIFLTSVAEMSPELQSDVWSPEWINANLGASNTFLFRSSLLGATCGEQHAITCGRSLSRISQPSVTGLLQDSFF